jgi:light-regulated signal transduction histidine kinase (bacteriophytochrome)
MPRTRDAALPDLAACADEAIHLPGSIQPHGALVAMTEPDLVVRVASENCAAVLGVDAEHLLGRPLGDAGVGSLVPWDVTGSQLTLDPSEHFPMATTLRIDGRDEVVDAVLHRTDGLLVVEAERGAGPLPTIHSYQLTRTALGRIQRAYGLEALYQVAVEEVRRLTGFDRVMIYRFDEDWNGQVVAEDRADGLTSFLGLRYPASDIPAQARALYRSQWLRLIVDVGYRPVPLVPPVNPLTGRPLDLSHASLRSVSPVHVEYLHNMGVSASMSISLLDRGELWGLVACHHYAGPHQPPYEIRVAAEFLGQTLSARMVDTSAQESTHRLVEARSTISTLHTAVLDEGRPAALSLTQGSPTVLDLVRAGGAVVSVEGMDTSIGRVPPKEAVLELVRHAVAGGHEVLALTQVPEVLPGLAQANESVCGALVLTLPDEQFVVWCRPELVQTVSWGGDPRNAEVAYGEDDTVRIGPRKSFELWQETVRGRSETWSPTDIELAGLLRRALLEALYARSRRVASTAMLLQRSLLPEQLPAVPGWTLAAEYQPLLGGAVGGDWYDVLALSSGEVVCVLGDVAGHGVAAAGTMGQLRNGLRAYLVEEDRPARLLQRLDQLVDRLVPGVFATVTVLVLEPVTGVVKVASAGHPPVCLVPARSGARLVPVVPSPPLGLGGRSTPEETTLTLAPGDQLVAYSDGMVERRGESVSVGLSRLVRVASGVPEPLDLCARLIADCRDPAGEDDATVLVLRRDP